MGYVFHAILLKISNCDTKAQPAGDNLRDLVQQRLVLQSRVHKAGLRTGTF